MSRDTISDTMQKAGEGLNTMANGLGELAQNSMAAVEDAVGGFTPGVSSTPTQVRHFNQETGLTGMKQGLNLTFDIFDRG